MQRLPPTPLRCAPEPMFAARTHNGRGQYDCDDFNSAVKPGQTEVCDGIDNDCGR